MRIVFQSTSPFPGCLFLALAIALLATRAQSAEIELTLQTRDPATGKVMLSTERIDPKRVGVIAVDVWNFHWCKTATMRVDAIVPRMNKALDAARALGMTVMLCPSDVVTHLIYVGFHTQVCLLGKPMGLKAMKSAGLRCVLARDMTDAHPGYDPARNFTPDLNTEQVVEHFEKHLAPSISFRDELAKLGKWDANWVVDPVRITPWGTAMRPHLFEEPITVTLTAPFQPGAEIRYTLDGSKPTPASTLYAKPLVFADTTALRAAAFRNGRAVCLESEGSFVRMGPVPPVPDVPIGDLKPIRNVGFGHTYAGAVRYSGNTRPPQKDKSNSGQDLKINRQVYQRGIGVHAPCELVYEVKPEYARFVALAGVDENLVSISNGSNLAKYPSVVFKVFIDGKEAAASPVMRILSPAWRFDVAIPDGARMISLVAMDAGDGSREDFADWANAGFIVKERR